MTKRVMAITLLFALMTAALLPIFMKGDECPGPSFLRYIPECTEGAKPIPPECVYHRDYMRFADD